MAVDLTVPPTVIFTSQPPPLIKAIQHQYVTQVRDLLQKGCSPNEAMGECKIRPLMVACYMRSKHKRMSVFRSLIQHDVDIELADSNGRDCIMYACALSLKEEVKVLLESRMYGLYSMDDGWNTPLHVCARYGSVDVLKILLHRMATQKLSFNLRNVKNLTPLDVAILCKKIKCIELLCSKNALSSFPKEDIAYYCQFTGGPTSSLDNDRLLFVTLSKYKLLPTGRCVKRRETSKKDPPPPRIAAKHDSFSKTKQKLHKDSISSVKSSAEISIKEVKETIPPVERDRRKSVARRCSIGKIKLERESKQELPVCDLGSGSTSLSSSDRRGKAAASTAEPTTPSAPVLTPTAPVLAPTQPKYAIKKVTGYRRGSLDAQRDSRKHQEALQRLSKDVDNKEESQQTTSKAKTNKFFKARSKSFVKEEPKTSTSTSIPNIRSPVLVELPSQTSKQSQLVDNMKRQPPPPPPPPPKSSNSHSLQVPVGNLYPVSEEDEDEEEDDEYEISSSDS